MNTILIGDALTELKKLPDEIVQCVVTSPPYWDLRDYGTATWEGGDIGCDHIDQARVAERERQRKSMISAGERADGSTRTRIHDSEIGKQWQHLKTCKKCGATRIDQQLGLEKTPEEYVSKMVEIFREVKRVLKKDGTLWLNLGDSYAGNMSRGSSGGRAGFGTEREGVFDRGGNGLKDKDLCGIPWRVAFALQADGWWLRQDIIWAKPNPMPESVTDRCTKSHEYIFLLSKSATYYCDMKAIAEKSIDQESYTGRRERNAGQMSSTDPGNYKFQGSIDDNGKLKSGQVYEKRNKRSVWTINTEPYPEAHFAVFPPQIPSLCIQAGSRPNDLVLDPFAGSGTTLQVAKQLGRQYLGIELNEKYLPLIERRLQQGVLWA